jgi:hypothetical protein
VLLVRLHALVFSITVALTFSTTSLATPKTTSPGRAMLVYVHITDKGITTSMYGIVDEAGSKTYVSESYVTRGQIAYFVVRNLGKKSHDFTVLGKKTPKISPGGKANFHVSLLRRGEFPYRSTLDRGNGFRGLFTVT